MLCYAFKCLVYIVQHVYWFHKKSGFFFRVFNTHIPASCALKPIFLLEQKWVNNIKYVEHPCFIFLYGFFLFLFFFLPNYMEWQNIGLNCLFFSINYCQSYVILLIPKKVHIFQTVRIIIFHLDSEFSYTVFQSTKTSLPLWESYPRLSIGWMPFLSTSIISGILTTFVFLSRIIIFLSYVYLALDYYLNTNLTIFTYCCYF